VLQDEQPYEEAAAAEGVQDEAMALDEFQSRSVECTRVVVARQRALGAQELILNIRLKESPRPST
jgi:hypothetical protein